jgi:hypothetical protein
MLKDEVRIVFDQFIANEVVPKGMLSYFVALIPKVSSPMAFKDFRPISLLGCLYKLLAKVLTWEPVLDLLNRKLNSWGHKYISLVGRVVINSVLNSIPIFFLSFLKMPVTVWKRLLGSKESFFGVMWEELGKLVRSN